MNTPITWTSIKSTVNRTHVSGVTYHAVKHVHYAPTELETRWEIKRHNVLQVEEPIIVAADLRTAKKEFAAWLEAQQPAPVPTSEPTPTTITVADYAELHRSERPVATYAGKHDNYTVLDAYAHSYAPDLYRVEMTDDYGLNLMGDTVLQIVQPDADIIATQALDDVLAEDELARAEARVDEILVSPDFLASLDKLCDLINEDEELMAIEAQMNDAMDSYELARTESAQPDMSVQAAVIAQPAEAREKMATKAQIEAIEHLIAMYCPGRENGWFYRFTLDLLGKAPYLWPTPPRPPVPPRPPHPPRVSP